MPVRSFCFSIPLAFLAMLAFAGVALAKPPIFSDLSFKSATEASRKEKKLVVIDAMASWCGPCKAMDRDTWTNGSVIKFIKENAVAIQFDVDIDKDAARKLKITGMPTVVVFVNGNEFDREVGYLDPKEMLNWLRDVQKRAGLGDGAGKSNLADGKKEKGKSDSPDRKKLEAARALASAGKHEEAAKQYAAMWQSLTKASIPDAMLMSESAADMRLLVTNQPATKKVFVELRDSAAPPTGQPLLVMPGDLAIWATLNGVVGEGEKTIAWYDKASANPASKPYIARIDRDLGPELVKAKRWRDVASVVRIAVAERSVRDDHVEWLEAAEKAGAADAALLAEARAMARG